jgi:hypothetical protein
MMVDEVGSRQLVDDRDIPLIPAFFDPTTNKSLVLFGGHGNLLETNGVGQRQSI